MSTPLSIINGAKLPGSGIVNQDKTLNGMLVLDGLSVLWMTRSGLGVHRRYLCETLPIQAVFATFSKYYSDLAVVILVSPRHLQINLVNGGTLDMALSVDIKSIHAGPDGLLLESVSAVSVKSAHVSNGPGGVDDGTNGTQTVHFDDATLSRTGGLNFSNVTKSSFKSTRSCSPLLSGTGKMTQSSFKQTAVVGMPAPSSISSTFIFSLASPYALLSPVRVSWLNAHDDATDSEKEGLGTPAKTRMKVLALHEDLMIMLEDKCSESVANTVYTMRLCKLSTIDKYDGQRSQQGHNKERHDDSDHHSHHHHHYQHQHQHQHHESAAVSDSFTSTIRDTADQPPSPGVQIDMISDNAAMSTLHSISTDIEISSTGVEPGSRGQLHHLHGGALQMRHYAGGSAASTVAAAGTMLPRSRSNSRGPNIGSSGELPPASVLGRQSPSLLSMSKSFGIPSGGGGGAGSRGSSPVHFETNRNAAIVQTLIGPSSTSLSIDTSSAYMDPGTSHYAGSTPVGLGGAPPYNANMYNTTSSNRSDSGASALSSGLLSRKQSRIEGGSHRIGPLPGQGPQKDGEWVNPHVYLARSDYSLDEWDSIILTPSLYSEMSGSGSLGEGGIEKVEMAFDDIEAEFTLNVRQELVIAVRHPGRVVYFELQAGRLTKLAQSDNTACTISLPLAEKTCSYGVLNNFQAQHLTQTKRRLGDELSLYLTILEDKNALATTSMALFDPSLTSDFQLPITLPNGPTDLSCALLRSGHGGQLFDITSRRILSMSSLLPLHAATGLVCSSINAIRNAMDVPVSIAAEAITVLVAASNVSSASSCQNGAMQEEYPIAVLLFGAFGLPEALLGVIYHNVANLDTSRLSKMMDTFRSHCTEHVSTSYGNRGTDVPIAAVLFDCIHTIFEDICLEISTTSNSIIEGLSTVLCILTLTTPDDSLSRHNFAEYYNKFLSSEQEALVYSVADNIVGSCTKSTNNPQTAPSALHLIATIMQDCTVTQSMEPSMDADGDDIVSFHQFVTPLVRNRHCCQRLWLNLTFLESMWHRLRPDRRQHSIISAADNASVWMDDDIDEPDILRAKRYTYEPSGDIDLDTATQICLALLEAVQENGLSIADLLRHLTGLHSSLKEVAHKALYLCMTSTTNSFVVPTTKSSSLSTSLSSSSKRLPLCVLFPPDTLKKYRRMDVVASVISQYMEGCADVGDVGESEILDNVSTVLEGESGGQLPSSIMRMYKGLVLPQPILQTLGGQRTGERTGTRGTDHSSKITPDKAKQLGLTDSSDGLAHVEAAAVTRFPEDLRMREVCRLLRSSRPLYLRLERAPETNDQQHRHKIQVKLLSLCRRSLAAPVGRGALTMGSVDPLLAERLPLPKLALSGRLAPTQSIVELDISSAPAELTLWPEFHNGVAAGLRILPNSRKVTRNWILFNRPNSESNGVVAPIAENGHAGMLLGLGLNGMLKKLSATDICDYLTQGHEPTAIAILIGMSATYLGKAETRLSRTLCLHLPALLPPRHWDMNVSAAVQSAALTGLGLLHCGTAHRLMTEYLLAEMIRRPNTIAEATTQELGGNSREALSLCAGWALGMVLLGRGTAREDTGILDLHIEDRLQHYVVGGRRPPESGLFPLTHQRAGDTNSKSSRVMEGDVVNTNVTAPGAMIALALMYIKSNNRSVADRIATPHSGFELDRLRPDFFIFRAVAQCLIMWDSVEPSYNWVQSMLPAIIGKTLATRAAKNRKKASGTVTVSGPGVSDRSEEIVNDDGVSSQNANKNANTNVNANVATLDISAACQAYLSITAGFCWGIGLTHAGTQSAQAKEALLLHLRLVQVMRDTPLAFLGRTGKMKPEHAALDVAVSAAGGPPLATLANWCKEKACRPLLELCISLVSLSLAAVMAGSGDIDSLRIIRELRWKADESTYGGHMALNMATGWLFLGGGNASLRRDQVSVATLLFSMCPRFPSRTLDNQYHIQAMRHLYAIAVEWRNLRVLDVQTGESLSVPVDIHNVDGSTQRVQAPCLLSELSAIHSIELSPERLPHVAEDGTRHRLLCAPLILGRHRRDSSHAKRMPKRAEQMTPTEEHFTTGRSVPPLIVTTVVDNSTSLQQQEQHQSRRGKESGKHLQSVSTPCIPPTDFFWRQGQHNAINRVIRMGSSESTAPRKLDITRLFMHDGLRSSQHFRLSEKEAVRHHEEVLQFGSTSQDVVDLKQFCVDGSLPPDDRRRRLVCILESLLLPPRLQWDECGLSSCIMSLPEEPQPIVELLLGVLC